MPGLNRIINQLNTFKSVIPILRVHKEYTEVGSDKNYLNIQDFKFNNSIVFKNVSFKYLNANKNAISKIDLNIIKGECIGIIGKIWIR